MNKQEFMAQLESGLKKHQIKDIEDILSDYRMHFDHQIENGKSEADISQSLGDVGSIINDYSKISTKRSLKWFDMVTVGFVAIPMLIMLYGLLISLLAATVSSWAIAVYYLFRLSTFGFMPHIPFGVHFIYVLASFAISIMFFCLSIYLIALIRSMTQQYLVKQTIRIGQYHVKKQYHLILKYSFWVVSIGFVLSYIISALIAKSFEFWHVWEWFS
ncbi:MAG: DUF1700 domain-containing protein [Tenericutes bacterium]|nr:DUF1700 domain-containing protein [Mycoplasmatota bacterium]